MDNKQLRQSVKEAYSAAADRPAGQHAFPVGEAFAESLGYPRKILDRLPLRSKEPFAGVSNVSIFADLPAEAIVLDLGCGAGLDALIAAAKVGPAGRVIGIDFSVSMLERAQDSAAELRLENLEFHLADAEELPLENGSVDVVLVNGIFNLNPQRDEIFRELARVTRAGGAVYGAELVLRRRLWRTVKIDSANWFA